MGAPIRRAPIRRTRHGPRTWQACGVSWGLPHVNGPIHPEHDSLGRQFTASRHRARLAHACARRPQTQECCFLATPPNSRAARLQWLREKIFLISRCSAATHVGSVVGKNVDACHAPCPRRRPRRADDRPDLHHLLDRPGAFVPLHWHHCRVRSVFVPIVPCCGRASA